MTDSDENADLGAGGLRPCPLYRPVCLLKDHQWRELPFMGDNRECERCGKLDMDIPVDRTATWVLGAFWLGCLVGGSIMWVMFL